MVYYPNTVYKFQSNQTYYYFENSKKILFLIENNFQYFPLMNRQTFKCFLCFSMTFVVQYQKLFSQSISPQSINSGATSMSQVNGSLSFTVGELVVLTQTDSEGNTLGGGFTSGSTISTAKLQEPKAEILQVLVFPNPTSDLLNIQINHSAIKQLLISIVDMQGKEVFAGRYTVLSNTIGINTAQFEIGTYFLNLKDTNNEILGTYKLIKH